MHAYINAAKAQVDGALFAALIVVGGAVLVAAIIGWIIAAAAAPFGLLLGRIAPALAVIVFAFTLYVTWRNAYEVLNIYVLRNR